MIAYFAHFIPLAFLEVNTVFQRLHPILRNLTVLLVIHPWSFQLFFGLIFSPYPNKVVVP